MLQTFVPANTRIKAVLVDINRPILFPLQIHMGNEYPIFREYKFVLLEFPWCKLLVR